MRFVVTIATITILVKEFDKEVTIWMIIFGLIAIVFNPIIPFYLNDKEMWIVIDTVAGILFLIKAYVKKEKPNE